MKLAELLAGIVSVSDGPLGEIRIGGISVDSRSVRAGDLFVAVLGAHADGHAYLADAARGGAAAALVERELPSPPLPVVRVPSTTAALPAVAVTFHGDPSAKLRVTGITGTNGKTTVTYLIEAILAAAGRVPAVIGTIDLPGGRHGTPEGLTTPFPPTNSRR